MRESLTPCSAFGGEAGPSSYRVSLVSRGFRDTARDTEAPHSADLYITY